MNRNDLIHRLRPRIVRWQRHVDDDPTQPAMRLLRIHLTLNSRPTRTVASSRVWTSTGHMNLRTHYGIRENRAAHTPA